MQRKGNPSALLVGMQPGEAAVENRQGEGKNSVGNVEAKELICMTHGHELKGGTVGGRRWAGWSGVKGGKWDNCNSIINKYIFKNSIM